MMIEGQDAENIAFGNSFTEDAFDASLGSPLLPAARATRTWPRTWKRRLGPIKLRELTKHDVAAAIMALAPELPARSLRLVHPTLERAIRPRRPRRPERGRLDQAE